MDFAVGAWVVLGGYFAYYMAAFLGIDGFLAMRWPSSCSARSLCHGTDDLQCSKQPHGASRTDGARADLRIFTLLRGGMLTVWVSIRIAYRRRSAVTAS
ncbi:hypothetical protein F2981_28640 (plasmid) [Sinorhizobium meliloti]|nr:hypothetical protein [Sinorhizobium meliloti]